MKLLPEFNRLNLNGIIFCLSLAVLTACDQFDISDASNEQQPIPVPTALQRAKLPAGGNLSATLTVDGAANEFKQENLSGDSVSFEIELEPGQHEFEFDISFESSSTDKITFVTATKLVNISSGDTVVFEQRDYQYVDTDGDLYTNLREIETGSDPRVSSSIPNSGDDNYEDNDTFETAYDVTGVEGLHLWQLSTFNGLISSIDQVDIFKFRPNDTRGFNVEFLADDDVLISIYIIDSNGELLSPPREVSEGFGTVDGEQFNKVTVRVTNAEIRDYYLYIEARSSVPSGFVGRYSIMWFR